MNQNISQIRKLFEQSILDQMTDPVSFRDCKLRIDFDMNIGKELQPRFSHPDVSLLKGAEITATGRWVFADISGSSERRDADAGRKTYLEWLDYENKKEFDGS